MKFGPSFVVGMLFLAAIFGTAHAHEYSEEGIKVTHPWTRATPPGATTAVGYLKLTNTGSAPVRLTGGSTGVAQRVEIHSMSMDGGVMRMRPVPGVDIAPGDTVELKAGGLHLMLIGLTRPLQQEEMVPLTLTFADGRQLAVELYVEEMGSGTASHHHS